MAQTRKNVQAPILRPLAERWSPRAIEEDRPVPRAALAAVLEAARWAPSCYNGQPWRFVVTDRFDDEDAWRALLASLAPANQAWARRAPVLILAADAPHHEDGRPNPWSAHDLGLAVMSLLVQATAEGLAAHPMAGFDPERAREAVGVPDRWRPHLVIALGHPGDPAQLDDELRARELAPRERRPLEEIAHRGRWGRPFVPDRRLGWQARYEETPPEALPWHCDGIDPDLAAAVEGLTPGRALDVGCGAGEQAVELAARGWEVVALDLAPAAIDAAKRRAEARGLRDRIRFVVGDAAAAPIAGGFDLVVDRGLLHCLADDAALFAYRDRLRGWLKRGGLLLLKCFSDAETRPEGPPRRVRADEIRAWFADGFVVEAIEPTVFPAAENPPRAWFARIRRR